MSPEFQAILTFLQLTQWAYLLSLLAPISIMMDGLQKALNSQDAIAGWDNFFQNVSS